MKKSFRFTLFTLAVLTAYVLSACGASTPAAAPAVQQPASPDSSANVPTILDVQVAFSGVVESMNGDQWVVDGKAVTVSPQAVADNIQVGDVVKVEATVGQDGRINTTRVQNSMNAGAVAAGFNPASYPDPTQTPPPSTNGEQEIFGVIEAMTDTTVTIGGVVYQLTNFSEVKGLLSVGDEVKIHFVTNPDGSLTIREIELRSSPDDNSNDNGNANTNDNGNGSTNDNGNINDDNGNGNTNVNDNGNSNDNDNNDDNGNDNGNDNGDDNGNDNANDDHGNDNGNDNGGNDNGGNDNGNGNDDD